MPKRVLDVVGLSESRDLHMRVAHLLREDELVFVHEYRLGKDQPDFVAVNPYSAQVMIVECKKKITDADELMEQIRRYQRALRFPAVSKRVYTLVKLTERTLYVLKSMDIQVFTVGFDVPTADYGNYAENVQRFEEVMNHFHPWHEVVRRKLGY